MEKEEGIILTELGFDGMKTLLLEGVPEGKFYDSELSYSILIGDLIRENKFKNVLVITKNRYSADKALRSIRGYINFKSTRNDKVQTDGNVITFNNWFKCVVCSMEQREMRGSTADFVLVLLDGDLPSNIKEEIIIPLFHVKGTKAYQFKRLTSTQEGKGHVKLIEINGE